MALGFSFWTGGVFAALALTGCLFEIVALILLVRFFRGSPAYAASGSGATLLKPLHGTEPRLAENLASFLQQDFSGPIQIVCGVKDQADGAAAVVEQLQRSHPSADIVLVAKSTACWANGKINNLANMLPAARRDVLVLSDSDIAVASDYLSTIVRALDQPGVGAVTCPYRGRADAGHWSRISAGGISYVSLPGVIVGYVTDMARPCMGSTIALTRETLHAIGGFERFADVLADDYAIGDAIAAAGQRVEMAGLLLIHSCSEQSFAALWRQKVRWSATIRGVAPMRHLGSIVTYPLPLALISAAFTPALGLPLAAVSLAVRVALATAVDYCAKARSAPWWMLPAIEFIEFLAFAGSFVARNIDWRGNRVTLQRDGRIAA